MSSKPCRHLYQTQVDKRVDEHDDNSNGDDNGNNNADRHTGNGCNIEVLNEGDQQTSTYDTSKRQICCENVGSSRLVWSEEQQVGEDRAFNDKDGYDLHLSIRLGENSEHSFHKNADKEWYPSEVPLCTVKGE